jgi:hypothetical protein
MALLAALVPLAATAQWTFDAEGSRIYDGNLSRAQRESDIIRDRAWTGRAAFGRLFSISEWDASLRGEARGARHDRYSGLDHIALGLGAGMRRKLGLGLTAPWIAADAAVFREDHDENVRDGRRARLSFTVGKRFDERWDGALSAAYDRRSQRHDFASVPGIPGRPFSIQGRSLVARAGYAFTERVLLFGSAGFRQGDVVSSTRRNLQIFRESAAIANDPAFGPDFIAYRLTGARTLTYSIGLSWSLGRRASLDATAWHDRTRAGGGLGYEGNVYSVSFVYSY